MKSCVSGNTRGSGSRAFYDCLPANARTTRSPDRHLTVYLAVHPPVYLEVADRYISSPYTIDSIRSRLRWNSSASFSMSIPLRYRLTMSAFLSRSCSRLPVVVPHAFRSVHGIYRCLPCTYFGFPRSALAEAPLWRLHTFSTCGNLLAQAVLHRGNGALKIKAFGEQLEKAVKVA